MYCPNPECPDRIATGNPGEYREDVQSCPVCGTRLEHGSWDELPASVARPDDAPAVAAGDDGDDVELLRTVDVAEADFVIAALDEARIPFWRRVEGPDGMILGAGRSAAAPGAEHVIVVPEERADEGRALLEELREVAREIAEAPDSLEWAEEGADEEDAPPPASGGGAAATVLKAVLLILMLLGMAAVLRILLGAG